MTCKNSVALAVLFFVVTSLSFRPVSAQRGEDRCEFSADITTELAATSAELIRVDAGSGSLTVEGRAGLSAVRVTGIACASDEWMLEELRVSLERRGSTLELETFHPRDSWGRNTYARIDLQVDVPYGMDAEIDDGSGWASLSGLGELLVNDGSGDLTVTDIEGSVDIDDGSGGLEIRDVRGDVFVDDGSGALDIDGVTGTVTVSDGSGSMDIRDVGESLIVREMGSGTLRVSGVEGDFTVRDGRNERIRYSGIAGSVNIPEPRRRGRRRRPEGVR